MINKKSELIKLAAAKIMKKEGTGWLLPLTTMGILGYKYLQAQQSQSQIPFGGMEGVSDFAQYYLDRQNDAREEAVERAMLPASRFLRETD